MPQFILDTSGEVPPNIHFVNLDSFTQGYIEALFFTCMDDLLEQFKTEYIRAAGESAWQVSGYADDHVFGFSDLSPEALNQIISDCQGFQDQDHEHPWLDWCEDQGRMTEAGRDFWYTRNGHGCGFWDGDWPEPYATTLTNTAKSFGEISPYLGEGGKVYF